MNDLRTPRLLLRAIDEDEAARILSGVAGPDDRWAPDFPFEGDRIAVGSFARHTAEYGEQRPFGHYVIAGLEDGRVVGGIGFRGRPTNGRVEVGYGLVPSARGRGYAAEALTALLDLARENGASVVEAETTPDNVASQRTLERAGFTVVGTDERLIRYEIALTAH